MSRRLYLFNSAFRGLYRENVLKTLMLPSGWINKYRYSDNNSDLELVKNLRNDEFENLEVTIVFIDRFYKANGVESYRYYPIRNGKLMTYRREMNRNAFYVELKECESAADLDLFNRKIVQKFNKLPKLTNYDPQCLTDGIYTILDNEDDLLADNKLASNQSWINNVKLISKTKAFSEKLGVGEDVVFIRFDLMKDGEDVPIINEKIRSRYKLTRGSNYRLDISYYYPIQEKNNNAQRVLKIIPSGHIKIEGTNKIRFNGFSETKMIYLKVDQSIKDLQNSLDFEYEETKDIIVVAPYETIEAKTVIGIENWIMFFILLLGFAITSIIINLDFSSGIIISIDWIIDQIFSLRFLAHLIQGAIILFMLKFVGEKVY